METDDGVQEAGFTMCVTPTPTSRATAYNCYQHATGSDPGPCKGKNCSRSRFRSVYYAGTLTTTNISIARRTPAAGRNVTQPCPAGSTGTNAAAGCTCSAGYSGAITSASSSKRATRAPAPPSPAPLGPPHQRRRRLHLQRGLRRQHHRHHIGALVPRLLRRQRCHRRHWRLRAIL